MKTQSPKSLTRISPVKARNHDIIVIGGSAGAFQILKQIISELPSDLPAAVFVVLHIQPERKSQLAEIFGHGARISVRQAVDGDQITPGRVYIASPDFHLRITEDRMHLDHGPRHNFSRPAVDPLFSSAARASGSAVIGVVLSGALDDGTAGLMNIKRAGGITIVQDPNDAVNPSMPASAQTCVGADHCVPAAKIAKLLIKLTKTPAEGEKRKGLMKMHEPSKPELSTHICPECNGPMWFVEDGKLLHFHCRIGHSFSGQSLLVEKSRALESALWSAVNALKDKANVCDKLAERLSAKSDSKRSESYYTTQAHQSISYAKVIEDILLGGRSPVPLAPKNERPATTKKW